MQKGGHEILAGVKGLLDYLPPLNYTIRGHMRRIHLAISVSDIAESVVEYSNKLGEKPVLVVPEYALWRTSTVNLSIRKTDSAPGSVRHLGWEDAEASEFTVETDCNGIVWENFAASHQADEINELWPGTNYEPE